MKERIVGLRELRSRLSECLRAVKGGRSIVVTEQGRPVARRRDWVEQKGMRVFSLYDPSNPMLEVDLFAEHPIDFEDLWRRAETVELAHTLVRVASIPHLIRLKQLAGRPQDLADIEALELILRRREGPDGR